MSTTKKTHLQAEACRCVFFQLPLSEHVVYSNVNSWREAELTIKLQSQSIFDIFVSIPTYEPEITPISSIPVSHAHLRL